MSAALTVTALQVSTPQGPRTLPSLVDLVEPLPGLPGRFHYELEPLDEVGVLFALRSLGDGPQVRLFVVAPHAFFDGYRPGLDQVVPDELAAADELVLLVVVRPAEGGQPPTANLLAPIVLDPSTGRAAQVVLDDDLPVRAPIG